MTKSELSILGAAAVAAMALLAYGLTLNKKPDVDTKRPYELLASNLVWGTNGVIASNYGVTASKPPKGKIYIYTNEGPQCEYTSNTVVDVGDYWVPAGTGTNTNTIVTSRAPFMLSPQMFDRMRSNATMIPELQGEIDAYEQAFKEAIAQRNRAIQEQVKSAQIARRILVAFVAFMTDKTVYELKITADTVAFSTSTNLIYDNYYTCQMTGTNIVLLKTKSSKAPRRKS